MVKEEMVVKGERGWQQRVTVSNCGRGWQRGEVGKGKVSNGKVGKGEVGHGEVGHREIILDKSMTLQRKGPLDSKRALI